MTAAPRHVYAHSGTTPRSARRRFDDGRPPRGATLTGRGERTGLVGVKVTTRELDLMAVLWERGASTVAEVQGRLGDELAYTTVLTILRTLEEKGYVGHTREGKAYRYHTLVGRECAGASAVRRLVQKMFQGSPELLLTHLVSDRALSKEDLENLRGLVDERLSSKE